MMPYRVSTTALKFSDADIVVRTSVGFAELAAERAAFAGAVAPCTRSASCVLTRSTTDCQSPLVRWRKRRIVGYHGLSSRSTSQRQSHGVGISVHTGRANAPARWTTAVSTP